MQAWLEFLQSFQTKRGLPALSFNKAHETDIYNGLPVQSIQDFGNPTAERNALANGNIICDLSHLGLLELQGADARDFLQKQVTNDIQQLNGSNAQYTAHCTPKGRMLVLFLAFAHHDHLHLQFPKALIEPIAKRLKMYVMRSKVSVTDVSETIVKIGLSGPKAPALLASLFTEVPTNDYQLASLENGALLKLPGAQPRYQIFTSLENANHIWETLAAEAMPVGASGWEWLEIQAGIPTVVPQTQEEFVPQMLNLDALNAINYKKGCYTGQEIVARTHYLGKVKRRTQHAHIASDVAPAIGDDVLDNTAQTVGKIVRVAPALQPAFQSGFEVLVECRLDNVDNDVNAPQTNLMWQSYGLTILPLPYALN